MERYFVIILSNKKLRNNLDQRLYNFAKEYEHTIMSKHDFLNLEAEYRSVLDSYEGWAKKPSLIITRLNKDYILIDLCATVSLRLTKVRERVGDE